jgi:putative aldouronate transport system substrate-binding protein
MNLLNWGIEGEHYVFVNDEKTIIDFPKGVNVDNTRYNLNIGWELPNQFIAHIWNGNDSDLWDRYKAFDEEAIKSPAYGFIYDPSVVQNELIALSMVRNRYRKALETGSVDPDVVLDEFNEALYRAGLQKVIDEKQKQLDEWLKLNH